MRRLLLLALSIGSSLTLPLTAGESLRDVIDREVSAVWQREGVTPAGPATDAVFLRRVHLDLVGTIPTADEARTFLDDPAADKRERLIDRLLDDPRFARHQADVWDMVLFGRDPPGYNTRERPGIQRWLAERFARNVPYDDWVRELLRAPGNSVDDGPPMFFVQYDRHPEDAAVAVTRVFLGVQLQCARCHDHPFEEYTQLDFYGVAAFFARLETVEVGKQDRLTKIALGERNTGDVLFTGPATDATPGKKGEPVRPKFMQGAGLEEPPLPEGVEDPKNFPKNEMPPPPHFSRKDALAEWITRADNPWFARAIANRIWAQFLGRGLVHPVDNLSPSNPPSHPELLTALAAELVAHDFDLQWYVREICNSRTYQLGDTGPTTAARPPWFQRARVRPLSAEELADAWRVATGYAATRKDAAERIAKNRYEPLTGGYALQFFGSPVDGTGEFQGGLHEHLYLNNGQVDSFIATAEGGLHHALATSDADWPERVEHLYLAILSRRPTAEETERFVAFLTTDPDPRDRLREAIWTLMTCSEFRFQH